MSDRRVKVIFEAEIAKFKQGVSDAASATEKLAQSTEKTGKSVDERIQKINVVAAADQRAAKAAGLLYNAQGQLSDANGKVLSSTQAAAHGVEAFSEAVYLSGHEAGVAAAATEAAAKKAAEAAEKQKAAWQTVAPVMMAAGAGIVAGVGLAVKKYAEFDKAMSSVQAATHESAGNMNLLREAAVSAGADTAFSAAEAAQGIEELAKAGVSTESILSGGLSGALSLAAAGNLGVAESAEIAASAMTQFKLSGDKIPHLADLLAAGAGKAQGSVQDMGAALNQSGLVASATGVSIEETTGTLAAFASAGLIGSDAGTSFKTMLQSLNPNSKAAAQLMDELGIKAYDASGEFIGMSEYAGVLQGALADMSSEQRNATLKTLFGSDAVRAANVLYEQGAEGIQKWEDAVNDAGYAAETAAIMQDNLAGDVEKLGGALDTVFIKSGSGANDFLRDMAQSAEDAVDAFGRIPGPILSATTSVAGIVGVTALAAGGFIKLAPSVVETWGAFKDLGSEGSKLPGKLGKVTKAVGILGATYAALSTAMILASEARSGLDKPVKSSEIINALSEITTKSDESAAALDKVFSGSVVTGGGAGLGGSTPTAVNDLASALDRLYKPSGFDKVNDFLGTIFGPGVESGSEVVRKNLSEMDSALTTLANSGAFEEAAAGFKLLHDRTIESGGNIDEVKKNAAGYLNSLRDVASGAGVVVEEQDLLNWALSGTPPAAVAAANAAKGTASALADVGVSASGAVEDMEAFLESLFAMGNNVMDSRDAAFSYQEQIRSIAEAQKEIAKGEMGAALNKNKDDFNKTTEAGKLANDEFQGLARKGMDEVAKMSAEGLGQDKLQSKLNTTYKDLVKAGEGFGLSGDAAKDLAREVLQVPEGVSVKTWMDSKAKELADETTSAVDGIPDMKNVKIIATDDGSVFVTAEEIQSIKDRTVSTTVTDEGTILQVQGGINNIDGTEEFILVNDDGTVQVVQKKINSTTGATEYIRVSDDGTVQGVQNRIDGLHGTSVTITVNENKRISQEIVDYGQGRKASGGRIPKKSTGGRLPYTGLGTDKILGMNSDGVPVSWVDDGEWVINERASSKHNALLGMINRDDPRIAQLAGLIGHASGGRVGWSQGEDAKAKRAAAEATRERKQAEKDAKASEKAYNAIDGKKENKSAKAAAKRRRDKDKRELAAAKKAEDKAKEELRDAKERTARLSEGTFDLKRDLKRGEITEAFTSGNGMSVVDQMFEASNNKDLSKKQRKAMRAQAYATEKMLLDLEKRSESLTKKMDKATEARDRLLSARDGVRDQVLGAFDMGSLLGQKNAFGYDQPVTKKSLLAYGKGLAAGAKTLSQKVKQLQKLGFHESMISQVIDEWSNAGTFELANAMLSMNKSERGQFNQSFKDLGTYGTRTGNSLTEAMAKGGLNAAQTLVDTLDKQQGIVEKAFYDMGKAGEAGFKRAWGIASPSKVMKANMGWIGKGGVDGLKAQEPAMAKAMADLVAFPDGAALSVPPSREVASYAAQSAAAPAVVIDYDRLAQAMTNVQLNASLQVDRRQAGVIVQAGEKFNGTHK